MEKLANGFLARREDRAGIWRIPAIEPCEKGFKAISIFCCSLRLVIRGFAFQRE